MKLLLALVASAIFAAALPAEAKTVKFPEKHPAFSFTLPDDWTTSVDKDGNLDCTSGDGSKYSFSIIDTAGMPNMKTDAEVKAYLPQLAKGMAEGSDLKDVKFGEIRENTTSNNLNLFGMSARGQTSGTEMVISLASFAAAKGHYFVLMGVSTNEENQANGKMMGAFFDSITPVAKE